MKGLFILLSLVLFSTAITSIRINEIMADPIDDESLNEWIELYNNDSYSINLSGWIIGDNSDNDTLQGGLYGGAGTILRSGSYAVITDDLTRVYDNFNVSSNALRIYVDDSSIGNGLINSGETIFLYDKNKTLIHSVYYNSTSEGLSWSFFNDIWLKTNSTPGYDNNGSLPVQQINETDNSCDFQVAITSEQEFFNSSGDFAFKIIITRIKGEKSNITLFRQIKNQYGDIEKSYGNITSEVTNSKTYSYSPNLVPGAYIIETSIAPECNDTEPKNNHDSKLLVIKGQSPSDEPSVFIERLYDLGADDKAKYGQTIKAKIIVYKGNSTKEAVELWAVINGESISKITKTNVYDKYANYTLTLPVQLYPNCGNSYPNGSAALILDGFGKQHSYSFIVEGITDNMCEYVEVEKTQEQTKGVEYSLVYLPETIHISEEFQSQIKIENMDNIAHQFQLWSYVYRGPKCYSGEREQNKITKYVADKSSKTITLKNKVDEAEEGVYKFKVMILKDDLKTPQEITGELIMVGKEPITEENKNETSEKGKSLINLESNYMQESEKTQKHGLTNLLSNPVIIYKSTTAKAKNLVPYFFISALIAMVFFLAMRKL